MTDRLYHEATPLEAKTDRGTQRTTVSTFVTRYEGNSDAPGLVRGTTARITYQPGSDRDDAVQVWHSIREDYGQAKAHAIRDAIIAHDMEINALQQAGWRVTA